MQMLRLMLLQQMRCCTCQQHTTHASLQLPQDVSAGGWAFLDDVATEAEECGWPSLRRGLPACRFDEGAVLDEAAEILLVKLATGNRFAGALDNGQRKLRGPHFDDNRAVF